MYMPFSREITIRSRDTKIIYPFVQDCRRAKNIHALRMEV
jgi:hypothetical protein